MHKYKSEINKIKTIFHQNLGLCCKNFFLALGGYNGYLSVPIFGDENDELSLLFLFPFWCYISKFKIDISMHYECAYVFLNIFFAFDLL